MKYDLIIACGDSFTEGCRDALDISISETWPGQVSKSLGIPFVNLAVGGSCNLDIAQQPLTQTTAEDLEAISKAKNPLILFGFTVMERFPYPSVRSGTVESCFSILPEHTEMLRQSHMDPVIMEMLSCNNVNTTLECHLQASTHNQNDSSPKEIDWFIFSTMQAIRMCVNWEKLIPNSTVAWGFIHINTSFFGNGLTEYYNMDSDSGYTKLRYPYFDRCFNRHANMKEIQSVMYDEKFEIYPHLMLSETDCHPNKEGIKLIANFFEDYINECL